MFRKRDLPLLLAAFFAITALVFAQHTADVIETGAWGLSFRTEGHTPIGPAGADELRRYDAVYVGDTTDKVLYLTFDAGYENGCTGKILDVLKNHQVPAAFFLVGNYIEKNPDLVKRMVSEGHTVGNHTMHHPDMSKLSDKAAFSKELTDLEQLFQEVTGKSLPKYYRPPQGIYSQENLSMAKELGYKTVFWSLAYADWNNDRQPTKEQAFSKLLPRVHNGAIVLLHSTSKTNAEILDELLTKWKEMGYRFAPISELFADK
jgi:peptidoglycan-N-acetylmuramic acid deacetylase